MTNLQRKRAYRFANFLINKIKRSEFDLGCFVQIKHLRQYELSCTPLKNGEIKEKIIKECGSVACAIGQMPRFNPARFKYESYLGYGISYVVIDKLTGHNSFRGIAGNYFGFDYDQITFLFTQNYTYSDNPTPATVGKRILGLLSGDKKITKLYQDFLTFSFHS